MANLIAAATLLFRDRFSAGMSAAAHQADRATDRMADGAERMARTTGRAAGHAGRAAGGLAHDTRDAGRQTGRSTRLMGAAWRGLDILDDISGVAGAVMGLASGFAEAAGEAMAMSRDVELAMARIDSIEAAAQPGGLGTAAQGTTSMAVLTAARLFATGRGGAVSEVVGLHETEFIAAAKEALSAGFEKSAAIALTKYAAGLGVAAEGSMGDAARLLRPMYALLADPAADAEAEVARLADRVARTQALYDIPSLPLLTEAITTAAPLAGQHGIASDVLLGALGAFHSAGTSGSEAGEAFNSILEEITSGMEELGLAKVETAAGGMDFPATLARLREYRVQSGSSDTAWVDRLVEVFGELGGRQLATLTSEQTYQRFTGGLPEIAESEGVMQRRLATVADTRAMRRARLEARKASNRRVDAEQLGPLSRAWLAWRETWQRYRTIETDNTEYRRTGYHPEFRPAGRARGGTAEEVAISGAAQTIPEALAEGVEKGGPALGAAMDRTLQREVDERLPHSDARRGPLVGLTASGRAIPETLAEGVEKGRAALGAAMDRTLQREVDERLPHSDARRGPLAGLTAAGRAAPETLAAGVKQGAGALDAAMTTALPTPPAISLPPPAVFGAFGVSSEPPAAPTLPPLIAASAAADLEPPPLPTLPPLVADSYAGDLEPPAAPALPPLIAASAAADLEPPVLPTLPPLVADTLTADLEPPAAPASMPPVAVSLATELEPPALPALPPLVADSYAADLDPPAAPALPPLIAASAAADLEPPALPTLPPLVADTLTADLEPPAAPASMPQVAASLATELEPPALPALPPLVADSYAADLDPPAAPALPPLIAASAAADLEPPALPTLPPLVADTLTADLEPPAAPASMPQVAASLATELEPPALPALPPLVADSYAAELEPPAAPALPPLIAASAAADLEPPALPTVPALVADAFVTDIDPLSAPDPAPLSTAPASAPPLLRHPPAHSELVAAVRDLTREIRRLRTENGGGVTIEHVELHAEDADLVRAAEGLAALRGGP